jgi:hypothetical protein
MKTWIFQGNPEVFDIDSYLAATAGLITWRVARYAEQIEPGDTVYIWRSQGDLPQMAGIVAEGTVVEPPRVQPDDPISADFWKEAPGQDELMRVRVRLNRIAGKREMLKREWMKQDSALADLLILRQAAGTNFPVEEQAAQRLGQLWRKTGTDWERDEVIAALNLYEQLLDKPISKVAGSEVERLAQLIGRVPTGVYNKLMNLRSIDPRDSRTGFEGGSKVDQATWDEFFDTTTMRIDAQSLGAENRRLWGAGVKSDRLTVEVLEAEEKRLADKPLDALLAQYAARPKNLKPRRQAQQAISYDRDPLVVTLRKRLAGYRCEVDACQSERFQTVTKEFFVEVHHLVPLAEGGPDTLENTVAVCATHHRFLHHGQERKDLTARLTALRHSDSSKSPP